MDYVVIFTSILCGLVIGYFVRSRISRWQSDSIERQAAARLTAVDEEIVRKLQEADIKARTEVVQAKEAFEQSTKARRAALDEHDNRLSAREEDVERKLRVIEEKERANAKSYEENKRISEELALRSEKITLKESEALSLLQRTAGMTQHEAKETLMSKIRDSVNIECAAYVRSRFEEAKNEAMERASELVAYAVKRYTSGHTSDAMTCSVDIPDSEIKGRIIGRDGRNVKAIESITGVTLLVDDFPGKIVISCFSPTRREIARQALEALIEDGRIHPASIEAAVEKARADLEENLILLGKDIVEEFKFDGVSNDILFALGRLKFRTSYSQNCLEHSIEVARIMGMMADELGLDGQLARRIGLFHDIGKALTEDVEGGHAKIGADLMQKYGEDTILINAVASHHEEFEQKSIYAVLCSAADAISSSRPGARSETTSVYYKRIANMEIIAKAHKGVKAAYAVQAGHELRLFLDPEIVSDADMQNLAREVCADIEANLKYPGQIRVIVIREQRCVSYAR